MATRWLHRLALGLCCTASAAGAAELADCNGAEFARVLRQSPAATSNGDARGVWLDGQTLRWPGSPAEGRFRLHLAAQGGIVARPGAPVEGATQAIDLERGSSNLSKALDAQFAYLGDGPLLLVPPKQRARLDAAWRGQLVLVREDSSGQVLDATGTQLGAALDQRFAAAAGGIAFGARPAADRTSFALWAPTAQDVALCVYDSSTAASSALLPAQRDEASGVWRVDRDADLSGRYYTWLVDVFVPGVGLVRNRTTDPYALSLGSESQRTWIGSLDAASVQPPGWRQHAAPMRVAASTDMTIYELHVRDFSINDASVDASQRGKYLAFTARDSVGMRHLAALSAAGVTDLHLLPVFDIASVPETGCATPAPSGGPDAEAQQALVRATAASDCFNWGYDPFHYTAPEGSYASDPADGAVRILEFRRMVQALHGIGLRVGMDVVYNHTTHAGQHPQSVLDRIVPGYYHRLDANGRIERSTCCDNTATERRMMAKLMIDSAVVWARDYRIDSFRFDLMGHQPRPAMEDLQRAVDAATGRHVQLIGEGWNFGEIADGKRFVQASQLSLGGSGIGTFSDRARDAVRGGSPGDNDLRQVQRQGYVNGLVYDPNPFAPSGLGADALRQAADLVRVGLAGSLRDYRMTARDGRELALSAIDYNGQPAGYVTQPGEVVNYVENHDNQTLFDVNVFKLPPTTSREDRARVQVLALAINAFSQGIAYFHAGGELLRSKSMDRNSFDSGDWFNRIDWTAQDNFFGSGLPPQPDNGASWALMRPLLADARIKPAATEIAWTRDAFLDLLRIRASSTLFRLRSAADVSARLELPNTGPAQVPTVLAGHLDGAAYEGANFRELLYLVNVDKVAHTLALPTQRGKAYVLHPVHRAAQAADQRPLQSARYDAANGTFDVPPRTAVVWVVEPVATAVDGPR